MNNAFVLNEPEESKELVEPILREKMENLMKTVEALQHIAGSEYWGIIQNNIFDVDLDKARSSLEKEKDTTEVFRLQGEIRGRKKFKLEKILAEKRTELEIIRKKING